MLRAIATAVVAIALFVVACDDGVVVPDGPAAVPIGVAPRFAPVANLDQNPAATVDNVRIRFLRDDGTVAIDTIVMWPADQDTLRVEIELEVEGAGETFDFLLQARDGEIVIFQSEGQLDVDGGGTGPPPDLTPVLEYQGEGASATELEVDAPTSMLAGGSVTLSATARDDDGAELPATLVWSSLDEDAASIDDAGVVRARHRVDLPARIVGRIAFKDVADTVEIPIRAAGVRITPESGQLDALGRTLPLSAEAFGADDAAVQGSAFDWRLLDESVLALAADGDEAEVTSLKSGSARVEVEAGGHADTARVSVRQVVESLSLSSPVETLTAGQTLQLEVVAADGEGAAVAAPDVSFASSDEAVATVDADGTVTGVGVGQATITASVDGDAAATSVAATTATTAAASVAATPTAAAAKTAAGSESAPETAQPSAKTAAQAEVVASVTLTVEAGSAESFTAVSGNGQTGTAGAALPEPVVVRLADAVGNPIVGADIAFSAATGSFDPATATTDAEGRASSTWTLAPAAGANTGSATATGTELAPLALTATGEAGPPASIAAVSGDGQAGEAAGPLAAPLVVSVTDAGGNPVAGVSVGFSTPDGGSFSSASPTTGADGLASTSWTLGPGAGEQTATAAASGLSGSPVAFTATAGAGDVEEVVAISGNAQTGTAGEVLEKQVVVEGRDANGNPVPGAAISFGTPDGGAFAATKDGTFAEPFSATADATGRARAWWKLGPTAGPQTATASGSGSVELTATAKPGPVDLLTFLSGDGTADSGNGQSGPVGSLLPDPLRLRAVDVHGNPVPGVTVDFLTDDGGSFSPESIVTDSNGEGSTTWTLGPGPGTQLAGALTPSLPESPLAFFAEALGGFRLVVEEASKFQSAPVTTSLPLPITVVLLDGSDSPIPGKTVTFTPDPGAGSFSPATAVTDADGKASSTWTMPTEAGAVTGSASVSSPVPVLVPLAAAADPGPPTTIEIVGGNNQSGVAGTVLPDRLEFKLKDTHGNGVPLIDVAWAFATGTGGFFPSSHVNTDENGLSWAEVSLPTDAGDHQVTATVAAPDVAGNPATFDLTATVGAASDITPISPTSQTGTAGAAVEDPPTVLVTDDSGNPVAGVDVTFTVTLGGDDGAAVGSTTITKTTGPDGKASTGWILGETAGTDNNVVEATAEGLTGSPVTFTASTIPGPAAAIVITNPSVGPLSFTQKNQIKSFEFEVRDQFGNSRGTDGASLSSDDETIATVVAATSTGGDIKVVTEDKTAGTHIDIDLGPLHEELNIDVDKLISVFDITPSAVLVPTGGTFSFGLSIKDVGNFPVQAAAPNWSSTDPSVIDNTASGDEEFTANTAGDATVEVSLGAHDSQATAHVRTISEDFETPLLGELSRDVIDPFGDDFGAGETTTGLSFTADGGNVGLVKNSALSICALSTTGQKLGTASGASVGNGGFPIRVTFAAPLATGSTVSLDVQALNGKTARVTLYNEDDDPIATAFDDVSDQGSCGAAEGAGVVSLSATNSSDLATYAIIEIDGGGAVFVIDNFVITAGGI